MPNGHGQNEERRRWPRIRQAGQIPDRLRDDPSLPDEERRRRSRARKATIDRAALAAEWQKLDDEQAAGLVDMINWLLDNVVIGAPGPSGIGLRPEGEQDAAEIITVIAQHPLLAAKVLFGVDDYQRYGGVTAAADISMGGVPILFRLRRLRNVARAIKAGGNAADARRAYRAVDVAGETMGQFDRARFLDRPISREAASDIAGAVWYRSAADAPPEPFRVGDKTYEIRRGVNAEGEDISPFYNVYDDEKLIASYDGELLVVEPEYRGSGLGEELMFDLQSRHFADVRTSSSRTPSAQRIAERVADRIERGELPQASVVDPHRGLMPVEHRTRGEIEGGIVEPERFGTGPVKGAERKRQRAFPESWVDRSYFNMGGSEPEALFRGRRYDLYEGMIDPKKIYDLDNDPMGFKDQAVQIARSRGRPAEAPNIMEQLVADQFEGYYSGNVVAKFTPTEVKRAVPTPEAPSLRRLDQLVNESIAGTGGATFDPRTGANMIGSQQYAVSPFKSREQVLDHLPTPEEIAAFRQANADLFDNFDNVHLGAWEENGQFYLDATMLVDNEADAIRIGQATDQMGIAFLDGSSNPPYFELDRIASPEAAKIRQEMLEEIPAFRAAMENDMVANLSAAELAEFQRQTGPNRQKWVTAYASSPTPREWASLIAQGYNARDWYSLSNLALARFGDDAPRFTALLAATSPQRSVRDNMEFALDIWKRWNEGGRPVDAKAIEALFDPFDPTRKNAVRALTASAEDLLDENLLEAGGHLSGLKVDAFYSNLMGNTQRVTLDTHMARAAGTDPDVVGTLWRNRGLAASVRAGTAEFNRLSGLPPITAEMGQAAAWGPIKAMTELAGRGGTVTGPGGRVFDAGETAFEFGANSPLHRVGQHIDANAVDFSTLMARDDQITEALRGLGIEPGPMRGTSPVDLPEGIVREQDVLGIGERIDYTRAAQARKGMLREARRANKPPPQAAAELPDFLFGVGALAAPFLKRYYEEAAREAEARRRSPFRLFGGDNF